MSSKANSNNGKVITLIFFPLLDATFDVAEPKMKSFKGKQPEIQNTAQDIKN